MPAYHHAQHLDGSRHPPDQGFAGSPGCGGDLCRQHGAEITAFYMTMGTYDLVLIIDAPNDDTLAKIALSIGKGGKIRTTTLRTSDDAQYREIIGSLG
jgi:uncharacterized protein with GYD domain